MLMSTLSDREQKSKSRSRKLNIHHDLFARVFSDMNEMKSTSNSNMTPVGKTLNFFKNAVAYQQTSSDSSWFPSQHAKVSKKGVTADDILLSFTRGITEDTQECVIPSLNSLSSALIDIGRQVISSPTKPQLYRDPSTMTSDQFMVIQVVEARNLRNSERVGKSSPYVTIQLIRSGSRYRANNINDDSEYPLRQTKVVLHQLNPYFGETFRFSSSDLAGVQIEVKVWNWSRYFRHNLLGCKTVNISGISSSRYEDFWIDLEAPPVAGTSEQQEVKGTVSTGTLGISPDCGRVHLIITLSKLDE